MSDSIFDTADPYLSDADLMEMMTFSVKLDSISGLAKEISYSGFNPVITFNICMKVIGKNDTIRDQLLLLITFGLTRGFGGGKTETNILDKTDAKGKDKLKGALKTFRVQFGKPGSSKTITIPRIMTAFPYLTFLVFNRLREEGIVRSEFVGELPNELRYIGSVAMVDHDLFLKIEAAYLNFVQWTAEELWGDEDFDIEEATNYAILTSDSDLCPSDKKISRLSGVTSDLETSISDE